MDPKSGMLFSQLTDDGQVDNSVEWDVVHLSQKYILQVYHSQIGNHFTNNAIICPGHYNDIKPLRWQYFRDKNGNNRQLLDIFPELINIGEVFAWVSDPVQRSQVPDNVIYITLAEFIDALQVHHSSAKMPSLTMVQQRDMNIDSSLIETVAVTWHHRGLSQVLRPLNRMLMGGQMIGRVTQHMNVETKCLEPAVMFTGIGPIIADRPGRSEVSFVLHSGAINNSPKFLGFHEQNYALKHWKNPDGMMTAECFKTQAMIDFFIAYIMRNINDKKMTNKIILQLTKALGIQLDALYRPSRMPTLALAELMICEPSHCLLGMFQYYISLENNICDYCEL